MKRNKKIHTPTILFVVLVVVSLFIGIVPDAEDKINSIIRGEKAVISLEEIPDFSGIPFIEINGNIPVFDTETGDVTHEPAESLRTYTLFGTDCDKVLVRTQNGAVTYIFAYK